MTTTLYYFTGTGNSLKIARDLAAALGDTELVPVAKALADGMTAPDSEAVGIVFPVYIWGMPLIVERFARRLAVSPWQYVFGVVNYGGSQGGTTVQLRDTLAERGITLAAGFGVKMPSNYIPLSGALPEGKQRALFAAEGRRIAEIAGQVQARARVLEKDNVFARFLFSTLAYRLSAPHIPRMDAGFRADERCNGCGVCATICPVGNIALENGRPVWRHRCEQCMACIQWCPQEAIQMGAKTAKRARYRCPGVRAADLMRWPSFMSEEGVSWYPQ